MKSLRVKLGLLAGAVATLAAGAAHANNSQYYNLRAAGELNLQTPAIVAGDPNGTPPDSPALRVDPNVATSPWTGVVSINIQFNWNNGAQGTGYGSFICTGALVSPIHIVTAAHCIDRDDTGTNPILAGGVDRVRAIFNVGSTFSNIITASAAIMHGDYKGFGNCAAAVTDPTAFCLNDDIAVLTLSQAAPAGAKIYRMDNSFIDSNSVISHVGYGTTGNGVVGHNQGPNFGVKRTGANYVDRPFDELDDEANFSGAAEVWTADFDGMLNGVMQDTHCGFGSCTGILANNVETTLGGGDSGGPSFKQGANGEWLLIGNNTFGRRFFDSQAPGQFGTAYGGMILGAYEGWLEQQTAGQIQVVPEPQTYALMLAGLAAVGAVARRRKNAA